jgi:uncharacterized protein (DUF302 family)
MEIIYKVKTSKNFEQAIKDLKVNLSECSFGVLWEINFKDKFIEQGLDFNTNFQVLEVCNPAKAKRVLDVNLDVGFFLPCKIVVYEDNNNVFIGMPKPTSLIGMIGSDDLSEIADEVEEDLKSAIDKSI